MDPQLAAHSGVFSLILQRMMLEAHAANGTILPHFGHVYPAGKDLAMPLMPLSRNDFKPHDIPPSWQSWRKDSIRAHKRQNLEMKISLLKKRKEQQEAESQRESKFVIKKSDDEEPCKESGAVIEGGGEECGDSRESLEAKQECAVDVIGGVDSDRETNGDQVFKSPHAADVHFKKAHKKPAVRD
nr:unnamed protein product [Haemonchus contortus]